MKLASRVASSVCFFFFNDTATTEIYTLSLHDALPISARGAPVSPAPPVARQVADRGGEPHLEPRIGALQPVVQPVGVAIHRGPTLEGEIGDEQDSGHVATLGCRTLRCTTLRCTSARH